MCQLERLSFYRYKFWKPQNPMISETFYFRKTCLFLLNFLFAQSPAVLNRKLGLFQSLCSVWFCAGYLPGFAAVLLTDVLARSLLFGPGWSSPSCLWLQWKQTPVRAVAGPLALCPARSKQARAAESSSAGSR